MRALIAGLGLIGGSIGIALRSRGWRVAYLDPHVEIEDARRAGAADERVQSFEPADVVVIATPVDVALTLLHEDTASPGDETHGSPFAGGAVVTTACSVMAPFSSARVVAGHPLAGSQERTLAAAKGDLFEGRSWFVDRQDAAVTRLIHDCSAVSELVDAAEHDRALALTSHLPQILSTALAASIDESMLRYAGSGLRTFLRLAGSDASVWAPVIEANRDNVRAQAERLVAALNEIIDGDIEAFVRAQELFGRMKSKDEG
jgi:prephenate dehydrogenase